MYVIKGTPVQCTYNYGQVFSYFYILNISLNISLSRSNCNMYLHKILYLKISLHIRIKRQHFVRYKMTATHFFVCSEPENVYHIGWFILLCVPHPISTKWSFFSYKIRNVELEIYNFYFEFYIIEFESYMF